MDRDSLRKQQKAAWQFVDRWFAEKGPLFEASLREDIRNQVACIRAEAAQKRLPVSQVAETIWRTELGNPGRVLAAALLVTAKEYVEGEAPWTKLGIVSKARDSG
ncbi:hypothetical protein [Acidithiobacillus caldus]|uniref:Uncharacterized protein n=1 Tax=Acidithiobacillus caldus TaxID=33059 RepID=A0A1E7YUD7_9PROT|nr:hypothetical protein [Acidithiobacillus caldus]OFC36006.1 hypothetical protein BAE27_06850 [Acidithiobacillus caldus]OFC38368.1 hypothetical protein BAE28_05820 [Acidithiobacillus caldus]OFC40396.1 hypothetical protein BAE29_05435 [Acidithiobacillus caldus]OFC58118.1 hypothetical protein BAE30_09380 [Acidithiobacillus caldus]